MLRKESSSSSSSSSPSVRSISRVHSCRSSSSTPITNGNSSVTTRTINRINSSSSSSSVIMSTATQQLLHSLINKSGLSKRNQNKLLQHIQSDPLAALPVSFIPSSSSSTTTSTTTTTTSSSSPLRLVYRMEPGPMKPGRRPQQDILRQCDYYQVERYRPIAIKNREQEIERLQMKFSQINEETNNNDKLITKKKKKKLISSLSSSIPIDPIHELMKEIQERHDFLNHMDKLGKVDSYRSQIQTEINLRVRQMEVLVKRLNENNNDHNITNHHHYQKHEITTTTTPIHNHRSLLSSNNDKPVNYKLPKIV